MYFTDVAANWLNVEVGEALLDILGRHQIEALLPEQEPSGIVQMSYGNVRKLRAMAKRNVARLIPYVRAGYLVVCTEPSAALMLTQDYPELLQNEETRAVAAAVREAVTLLSVLYHEKRLKTDFAPLPLTVGYHEPCHLKALRPQGDRLALFRGIPQLNIVPLNCGCCGLAGTYGMRRKNYHTSMQIGQPLFERLASPDIDFGLTECSACRMQMEQGVPAKKTLHPLTLLAAAYGGGRLETV